MVIKNKTAEVQTAFGEKLDTPIRFPYSYEELEKGDEIPADEVPNADDIRQLVNSFRNAAARAKAQTQAFKDNNIEPKPLKDNPAQQWRNFVKNLLATGKTQQDAETLASQLTGYTPSKSTEAAA